MKTKSNGLTRRVDQSGFGTIGVVIVLFVVFVAFALGGLRRSREALQLGGDLKAERLIKLDAENVLETILTTIREGSVDYDWAGCTPDIDRDGSVGAADLTVLQAAWGSSGSRTDLNRDGSTDGADLGILLAAWGNCTGVIDSYVRFDGEAVVDFERAPSGMKEFFRVSEYGPGSFYFQKTLDLGEGAYATYFAACVTVCDKETEVKKWIVRLTVINGGATKQQSMVVLSRKESGGPWGATTAAKIAFNDASTIAEHSNIKEIRLADFDGDGETDLVVGADSLEIYRGTGGGGFKLVESIARQIDSLSATDVDGDGIVDLIYSVAHSTPAWIQTLSGVGDGTFLKESNLYKKGENYALSVRVADVNADSVKDLIFVGRFAVNVALGIKAGGFEAPTELGMPKGVGCCMQEVSIGDLNGDGHLDLVSKHESDKIGTLSFLNRGDGTFKDALEGPADDAGAYHHALADFDGDLKLDEISHIGGTARILRGNGDGTFEKPVQVSTGDSTDQGSAIKAVDIDGDGDMDFIAGSDSENKLYLHINSGDGTFETSVPMNAPGGARSIDVADLNGDGSLDIVVGSAKGVVSVFSQRDPDQSGYATRVLKLVSLSDQ